MIITIPPRFKGIAELPAETVMFQLLASAGANIRDIFGLLLPHFQSVLPFFFSFFQQCIKPTFHPVFHRKFR